MTERVHTERLVQGWDYCPRCGVEAGKLHRQGCPEEPLTAPVLVEHESAASSLTKAVLAAKSAHISLDAFHDKVDQLWALEPAELERITGIVLAGQVG